MTTPRFTSFEIIELHLSYSTGFARKYGKRVRAAGGTYSECRGNQTKRYVTISTNPLNHKLINDILWDVSPDVVMLRGASQGVRDRIGTVAADWVLHIPKSVVSTLASTAVAPVKMLEQFIDIKLGTPAQAAMAAQIAKRREEQFATALLERANTARRDALAKAAPRLLAALQVFTTSRSLREYLQACDPQALAQADAAINAATGELTEAA